MISRISKVAAVAALAVVLSPTARANAANCATYLGDTLSVDCKNAIGCQKGIHAAIAKFYTAVQGNSNAMINATQKGSTKKAPVNKCIGGLKNTKACLANNGVCKSVSNKGKVCSSDVSCDGVALSCDRAQGCNQSLCVGGANNGKVCTTAATCPLGVCTTTNDLYECQIDTSKSAYGSTALKAQTALRKAILGACQKVGKVTTAASIGLTNLTDTCPGAGTALTDAGAYDALIDCITNSVEGDLISGKLSDAITSYLAKSTGTGSLPPKSSTGTDPRAVLQLGGSQALQVGTALAGNPISAGGGLTLLAGASCGNGNKFCLTNANCGSNLLVPDVCTDNSNADPGCSSLPCRALTAPTGLKANGIDGNTLTVSAQCASTTATCLVTKTKNAGNGTPAAGHINFLTGEVGTLAPIATDVYITAGPGADCNTVVPCPSCDATLHTCGLNSVVVGAPCTAAANTATQECPPALTYVATVPNPLTISTEPKSFTANPDTHFCGFCDNNATDAAGFATDNGICDGGTGFCLHGCYLGSGDAIANAECTTKVNAGCTSAGVPAGCCTGAGTGICVGYCDEGSTTTGFQGVTTMTQIDANGVRNQYAPIATGLFCTGKTGISLIDGSAGLPGPVRVTIPYTQAYLY
jgi:hypothetical protein